MPGADSSFAFQVNSVEKINSTAFRLNFDVDLKIDLDNSYNVRMKTFFY
jgi:hypothetical protein